jgi:hypothetical protein
MSRTDAHRFTAETAAEVAGRYKPGDALKVALVEGIAPLELLSNLTAAGAMVDAVQFLAHAVPTREGVWWACRAARSAAGEAPDAVTAEALRATEAWVADPTEAHRRAAGAASDAATLSNPAGCAAVAAFWSGGSLGPPDLPAIPPGEHLFASGVVGAVLLAAAAGPSERHDATLRAFLDDGLAIARGEHCWADPAPVAPTIDTAAPKPGKPAAPGLKQAIQWE